MRVKISILRYWTNLKVGIALADTRKLVLYGSAGLCTGGGALTLLLAYDCESVFYDGVVMRILRRLDPETVRRLCIRACKWGLCPYDTSGDMGRMETALALGVSNMLLSSPIGIAAGGDPNAEAFARLFRLGVSHVEVGSVTPEPQSGNPPPRLFVLEADGALLHRSGEPNDGAAAVKPRLQRGVRKMSGGVLGVNLAPNAGSADPAADFERGIRELGPSADYLVLNLLPLRDGSPPAALEGPPLHALLRRARRARDALPGDWVPPLMVKIPADLPLKAQLGVALGVVQFGLDGIVVGGGTLERGMELLSELPRTEEGRLCGRPCASVTNQCIANLYRFTRGHLPIVASGGVLSSLDAYAAIRSGACMVQVHSALALQGPGVIPRMRRNLWKRVKEDGYHSVGDAIGADVPLPAEPRRSILSWLRWWR